MSSRTPIVLAGATGNLGGHIARALRERGAPVKALVRPGSAGAKVAALEGLGVEVARVDPASEDAVARACEGGACVVSALSGLRDVVVDAQSVLLAGAVRAGVPRFFPSDYSIDFTRLPPGGNRNLDLRREFHARLAQAPVRATTVFCGMFTELLTGDAPFLLFGPRRVLCWGDPDQRLDFTTVPDVAAFTAAAALDPETPRTLRVAGDEVSARDLAEAARAATGQRFGLLRPPGGLRTLRALTRLTRALSKERGELYPPWQGMQYMHDMYGGRAKLAPLDNGRYPGLRWTGVREVLTAHRVRLRAGAPSR
jgi:nucleoside-diphosphate-sugar epimerase